MSSRPQIHPLVAHTNIMDAVVARTLDNIQNDIEAAQQEQSSLRRAMMIANQERYSLMNYIQRHRRRAIRSVPFEAHECDILLQQEQHGSVPRLNRVTDRLFRKSFDSNVDGIENVLGLRVTIFKQLATVEEEEDQHDKENESHHQEKSTTGELV